MQNRCSHVIACDLMRATRCQKCQSCYPEVSNAVHSTAAAGKKLCNLQRFFRLTSHDLVAMFCGRHLFSAKKWEDRRNKVGTKWDQEGTKEE